MPAVESSMKPLGWKLPDFELPDASGVTWSAAERPPQVPGTLVQVICNHCPYVLHIGERLGQLTTEWMAAGLSVIAINPNDPSDYPDDAPEFMPTTATRFGWRFPYLVDDGARLARILDAQCTPDFYLFDATDALAYRGRFDASTPGNGMVASGADLAGAVASLLAGTTPDDHQLPSIGCSIKWPPDTDSVA